MTLMKGKTVVITGPTSGIGKEIATGLARLGADLVLGCRDVAAGRALAGELGRASDGAAIEVAHVDLASRKSTEEFALDVLKRHGRLDVLVNNAAVSRGSQSWAKSPDGIELTFATNVIGYFLTSKLFLPRLRENAHARIVNVASTFASDLDLDDLQFLAPSLRQHEGVRTVKGVRQVADMGACPQAGGQRRDCKRNGARAHRFNRLVPRYASRGVGAASPARGRSNAF